MKRKLPTIEIEGTIFFVDVINDELRQRDAPDNTIPFGVFDPEDDGYTFLYDMQRRNVPENRGALKKMEPHFKWVTLPAMMELDPEGIAIKYGIPLEILCPEIKGNDNLLDDIEGEWDEGPFEY